MSTISYPMRARGIVVWRAISGHGVPRVKLENEFYRNFSVGGDL